MINLALVDQGRLIGAAVGSDRRGINGGDYLTAGVRLAGALVSDSIGVQVRLLTIASLVAGGQRVRVRRRRRLASEQRLTGTIVLIARRCARGSDHEKHGKYLQYASIRSSGHLMSKCRV